MLGSVIDCLLDALSVVAYLVVGTLYARANAQRCFEAAAKAWSGRTSSVVIQSYRERMALYVLVWPLVWPVRLIARVVDAPVGDLDATYHLWQLTQEQINLGQKELE